MSAIKIKDYLDQINCSEPDRFGSPSESFVFDTDILNTMSNDSFSVYMRPSILNEGFSESSLAAMKVLSMGGANSGTCN